MSMKSKSVKRLIVLSCAAVVILGGTMGAYVFRKFQVRKQLAHDRTAGLAAVEQKDYPTAVKDLGEYLGRYPGDIEALKAYVVARPQVGAGEVDEVRDTLAHLRQLILLDPSNTDARRQLMNIYWHYGYAPETEEQAQALLQKNPNDPEALKYLVLAKLRLRGEEMNGSPSKHIASAREIADRWAAADPGNPEPDFLILELMQQNGDTPEQILARARELGGSNPESPLAELILAEGYRMTNDRTNAVKLLKEAAAQQAPSTNFAKTLAHQLNLMGLYHESIQLLENQAKVSNDPTIAEELANRQWEMSQPARVIALTDGIETKLSTEGKGIRAVALFMVGRKAEAEAIQHDLSQAATPTANAWAMILSQIDKPGSVGARQIADACEAAQRSNVRGRDPYLEYFLAEAYQQLGERELAIDGMSKAAQESPSWTLPLVVLSQLELEMGRPALALQAATVAWNRSQQTNVGAAIAIAKAWDAVSESGGPNGASSAGPPAQLINLVEQMHQRLPQEQQVLAMYISLLCQQKPPRLDQARAEIQKALANDKKLTVEGMVHLAGLSQKYKLGVTEQCYAQAQQKFGMSTSLAYAEAMNKFMAGDAAGGRAILERARPQDSQSPAALEWELAHARYLEAINDPHAAEAWMALGDAHPDKLGIQQAILQIHSVAGNREFLARTIERVRALTGDNAITWKLAKARLALSGNPSQQELAQTSLELKQIIGQADDLAEPHILLAECYDRLGNINDALNELQTAQQKDPNNVGALLYYAGLLEKHGDFDKASSILNALPASMMTAEERGQAAELLANEGDSQHAAQLLSAGSADGTRNDLLLASLDLQRNQIAEVEALCTKMLAHPDPSVIAFAADFYASHGRMGDAERTLAMLNDLKLPAGTAELVRGEFAAKHQSIAKGITELKTGTAAAPTHAELWRKLVQVELATGQGDAAKQTLTQSRGPLPDDAGLSVLRDNQNLLAALCSAVELRPAIAAVVVDPRGDNPVLAALKQIGSARQTSETPADLAASLQSLLDENPHSLPLRDLVIQSYLGLRDVASANKAAQLATEAMQLFPSEIDPIRLTAQSLLAAGRPGDALGYLKIWHDRAPGNSMGSDLLSGEAYFALNRPQDAAEADQPYVSFLMAHPDAYAGDLMVYGASLNATGDSGVAAKLIWPLVMKDPQWRNRWITLALHCKTPGEIATWLDKVQPEIPKDDSINNVALAESWHGLALKTGAKEYAQKSRAIFQQLVARNDLPAATLEAMGVMDEELGETAEAESLYRRAIAVKPDQTIALNNLAMILARRDNKLDEAAGFARRAVASAPGVATISDTLAYVEARKGDYADAAKNMQHAVDLDPENMLWQVHEAKYYWEGGKHRQAEDLATKINIMVPPDTAAGRQSLREWEALKTEMGKQASAGG